MATEKKANPEVPEDLADELVKETAAVEEEKDAAMEALSHVEIISKQSIYDVEDHETGSPQVRKFDDDGNLIPKEKRGIEDPLFKRKADELKFMNEPVTIRFHKPAGGFIKEDGLFISVNNKPFVFYKGRTYTVPRFVVSALMEMQRSDYSCEEQEQSTDNRYVYPESVSTRYPFDVIEDRNPKGRQWFRMKQREPS